jgi:hypothetical protein
MIQDFTNDLITLVADKDTEHTLKGLFSRHQAFGIKDISQTIEHIFVHPNRDGGVRSECVDFLRPFSKDYKHALVLFDHEGCGHEDKDCEDLEIELEAALSKSGWDERASVIILNPEIEIWIWGDSPNIAEILEWKGKNTDLRGWLIEQNFLENEQSKPPRPKEAYREVLREVRKPPSAAIFLQLAEKVSFKNCRDRAFLKLKETLQNWFSII